MIIISVDLGHARTGLAISDKSGFLASSLCVIEEHNDERLVGKIADRIKENHAEKVVVGLPKNMDGSEGFRAETVRAFVALLGEETDLPLTLFDERLSTVEAHRMMDLTGTHGKKRRDTVDTLSAQIILQDYLDKARRSSGT